MLHEVGPQLYPIADWNQAERTELPLESWDALYHVPWCYEPQPHGPQHDGLHNYGRRIDDDPLFAHPHPHQEAFFDRLRQAFAVLCGRAYARPIRRPHKLRRNWRA